MLFAHYIMAGKAEGRLAVNPTEQIIPQNTENNVIVQTKVAPDGRVFTVTFTDEDPEYVMYSFPPNNGVEYEVGEVMAAGRHGHVMTYGGVFDSSNF